MSYCTPLPSTLYALIPHLSSPTTGALRLNAPGIQLPPTVPPPSPLRRIEKERETESYVGVYLLYRGEAGVEGRGGHPDCWLGYRLL